MLICKEAIVYLHISSLNYMRNLYAQYPRLFCHVRLHRRLTGVEYSVVIIGKLVSVNVSLFVQMSNLNTEELGRIVANAVSNFLSHSGQNNDITARPTVTQTAQPQVRIMCQCKD